jgi:hypothetical protein
MSLGSYDEDEHERRAQKTAEVDADFEGSRGEYRGTLEFDSGESADELIEQFHELQDA